MGAIFRVSLKYLDLIDYLKEAKQDKMVYATHLEGQNIYRKKLTKPSIVIMGNESEGVSEEIMSLVNEKLKIPIEAEAESFNVSIATAIVLAEFKRQFATY